jgi:hypothetical protein
MLTNLLYLALGMYVPAAVVFGFLFILGGGKTSNFNDVILSIVFFPGIIIAFGFVTLQQLFQK